jgi:hypothetical protein
MEIKVTKEQLVQLGRKDLREQLVLKEDKDSKELLV